MHSQGLSVGGCLVLLCILGLMWLHVFMSLDVSPACFPSPHFQLEHRRALIPHQLHNLFLILAIVPQVIQIWTYLSFVVI